MSKGQADPIATLGAYRSRGARCQLTRMLVHSIKDWCPDRIGRRAKVERTAVCVFLAIECVRAALVPSAARDLPAFYISVRKLGSLGARQGCDRDQPVEHATQILAGDEMVAPAWKTAWKSDPALGVISIQ